MFKCKMILFYNRAIARFFSLLLLLFVLSSCIDDNYSDIEIDDSINWEPNISVPVGEGSIRVDSYFGHHTFPDSIPVDSFLVYYEDNLFYLTDKRIQDTFHLNFTMDEFIEERENIKYLSLRLAIRNGYPTKTETQVYLYYGRELLDSLFSEKLIIDPGKVNKKQNVYQPSYIQHDVSLDSSEIDNLYRADHAVFQGAIYVTNEKLEEVKFYEDYNVNAQIGLQAKLRVHPSDFD